MMSTLMLSSLAVGEVGVLEKLDATDCRELACGLGGKLTTESNSEKILGLWLAVAASLTGNGKWGASLPPMDTKRNISLVKNCSAC